jgi:class 3 adenylate cyclase
MAEERRLVTILFADVVGSTALGEALDPEDMRTLLGRLFSIARDAIERHGGRVEKFIGDAIMAVFGLPTAHEDDAARALDAALDLRDRVRADEMLADRLPIRLGVTGGEVIATRDADATEFLVTGDPVNTAARLQQSADAWSIVVGDRTVRAAGDRFRFGSALAIDAKGKAAPIQARELLGRATERPTRKLARIVGRDADVAQLELVGGRAFDERRPYLVSVVAPAGVGKTRLLEEFLARLEPTVRVALAQCLPYGQRLTYWPMRAILLSIVGLPEQSSADDVRSALAAWLQAAGEPDPERIAELLAATIGASEVESDRLAVFSAWRRLIELAAERAPLVLVIEDLHWSSDSLLDLVEAILQPRADVPLLMLALARPELLDRRPGWGGGRRNAISIALEPLPSGAVAALVADLLERPAPEIVEAVVARAEGNPFYAGEIVRSLVDRLGPAPDAAAVGGAIAALPDTVHATVLARLDALEPVARRVVQLAGVLGRTFEPRAICAIDGSLDPHAVEQAVDALVERDLVRPSPRGGLAFRHILIREVAFGTLPRGERARLHAAAGRWLASEATETGREDELAELVAFHLREAVTLGGMVGVQPDADLTALAVTWLRRAAEAAAAGAATVEAARHLNAAIELAPRDMQPDLYERLGAVWTGGDQAAEAFARANELGRELGLGDEHALRTLAQEMIVRSRWVGSIGRPMNDDVRERRYAEIERLIEIDVSPRSRLLGVMALGFRPMAYVEPPTEEQIKAGDAWARQAVDLARAFGDPNLLSEALDALGLEPMGDDRMDDVIAVNAERERMGDRISTEERSDAGIVRVWAETIRGHLTSAERGADRTRAGLMAGQASSFVLGATAWRMVDLFGLGRWDEVMVELGRAERAWAEAEAAAPGFAASGFIAAFLVARARADTVSADRVRELILRIDAHTDPSLRRSRRLATFVDEDLSTLAHFVVERFHSYTPRLDYVFLGLVSLADRQVPVDMTALDELIDYSEQRSLDLVSSQARRLRGVLRGGEADLDTALATFTRIGMVPFIARARCELGLLRGDSDLVDRGLDDLAALGDVDHAARVVARRGTAAGSARIEPE